MLENFLFPKEIIRYQSPCPIRYGDDDYTLYVTDQRLLAHKSTGLIFKKDRVIAERLDDIKSLSYDEQGLIFKTALLTVETDCKKMSYTGRPLDIKTLWQEVQRYIRR